MQAEGSTKSSPYSIDVIPIKKYLQLLWSEDLTSDMVLFCVPWRQVEQLHVLTLRQISPPIAIRLFLSGELKGSPQHVLNDIHVIANATAGEMAESVSDGPVPVVHVCGCQASTSQHSYLASFGMDPGRVLQATSLPLQELVSSLKSVLNAIPSGETLLQLLEAANQHILSVSAGYDRFGVLCGLLSLQETALAMHSKLWPEIDSYLRSALNNHRRGDISNAILSGLREALAVLCLCLGPAVCRTILPVYVNTVMHSTVNESNAACMEIIRIIYEVTIPDHMPAASPPPGVRPRTAALFRFDHSPMRPDEFSFAIEMALSVLIDAICKNSIRMELNSSVRIAEPSKKRKIYCEKNGEKSGSFNIVEWTDSAQSVVDSQRSMHLFSIPGLVALRLLSQCPPHIREVVLCCRSRGMKRNIELLLQFLSQCSWQQTAQEITVYSDDCEDDIVFPCATSQCYSIHIDFPESSLGSFQRCRYFNGINNYICEAVDPSVRFCFATSRWRDGKEADSSVPMSAEPICCPCIGQTENIPSGASDNSDPVYSKDTTTSNNNSSSASSYPKYFEETILIDTVVVPQCLVPDVDKYPFRQSDGASHAIIMVDHYLYSFAPSVSAEKAIKDLQGCESCPLYIRAIGNCMIALLCPLPEIIIGDGFPLCLRQDIVIQVGLNYEGCHELPVRHGENSIAINEVHNDDHRCNIELLLSIQRFHKAILCWEVVNQSDSARVVPIAEWTRHAEGAYYLILPVTDVAPTLSYSSICTPTSSPLDVMSNDWKDMVWRSSLAAEALTKNLYDMEQLNASRNEESNDEKRQWYPSVVPNYTLTTDSLVDKLFCRSADEWYVGYDDSDAVSFSDVMKYVSTKPDINLLEEGAPLEVTETAITFADHYRKKNIIPDSDLDKFTSDSEHRLVSCFSISRRITLQILLRGVINHAKGRPAKHKHVQHSHLPPEYTCILGDALWFFMGQSLPSVIWRLQAILLAHEANFAVCSIIRNNVPINEAEFVTGLNIPSMLTLEAHTPRLSIEDVNNERLEVLGDCVLKFIVTSRLFDIFPHLNEGQLTEVRSKVISNANLYRCSIDAKLYRFIRGQTLSTGKLSVHLKPSGISATNENTYLSLWNHVNDNEAESKSSQCDTYTQLSDRTLPIEFSGRALKRYRISQSHNSTVTGIFNFSSAANGIHVKAKVLADHIEAIIGLYYMNGGLAAAETVISGLNVLPLPQKNSQCKSYAVDDSVVCKLAEKISSFKLGSEYSVLYQPEVVDSSDLRVPTAEYSGIEAVLGYTVQNRDLFQQAFNCSYGCGAKIPKKISFERLEFLGDAVLDTAILQLLFDRQGWANPGHISFQKSDATNNLRLAVIALELGYDRYITAGTLPTEMRRQFREILTWRNNKDAYDKEDNTFYAVSKHCLPSNIVTCDADAEEIVHEWNHDDDAHIHQALGAIKKAYGKPFRSHVFFLSTRKELKKLLADSFEAVIGAVYLDSNRNLEVISDIVTRLNLLPQLS